MQTQFNAASQTTPDAVAPAPVAPPRFVDRRSSNTTPLQDRRQFGSSHSELSEDARELALAIDGYKARHRRRYITFEEMLAVIRHLGYSR